MPGRAASAARCRDSRCPPRARRSTVKTVSVDRCGVGCVAFQGCVAGPTGPSRDPDGESRVSPATYMQGRDTVYGGSVERGLNSGPA